MSRNFDFSQAANTGITVLPDLTVMPNPSDLVMVKTITGGVVNLGFESPALVSGAVVTIADTAPVAAAPSSLWWDSTGTGLYVRYNDGSSTQWVSTENQAAIGTVKIADLPPTAPDSSLWWDSGGTGLYVRYNDGNSIQWVAAQNPYTLTDSPHDGNTYARQSGNWIALLPSGAKRELNVKDFGAKGDGVTNDAPAFAAALAAVANGGNIFVPAGNYNIGAVLSQAINAGVSFTGAGSGVTTLSFSAGTDGLAFSLSPTANVHVSGLTIRRATAGTYTNIGLSIVSPVSNVTRPGNTTINDVTITGVWLTGISINSVSLISLDHVLVDMANATGSGPGTGISLAGLSASQYLVEVILSDVETIGGSVGLLIGDWIQGVYVTNSRFIGNDYGISWPIGSNTHANLWLCISNSHFNSGTRGVLSFAGSSVEVVNTYTLHFGIPSVDGQWGAFEFHNIEGGLISNNGIYAAGTGSNERGIMLNGGNNCIVSGNFISNTSSFGIYINATLNTLVTGNIAALPAGIPLLGYGSVDPSNQAYGNQLNGVSDMTMDTGGNLTVHGAINATGPVTATGAVICAAGKFQIAPAYYLQRDSGGNWNIVENGMTTFSIGPSGGVTAQGNITAAGGEVSSVTYWASGKQVLGPQIAGWGASTGGARGPITATSTLAQVAAALAQLLTDLRTHGMIGG